MANARKTPLELFRKRQKQEGIVRVEVQVCKEDAVLLRGVAERHARHSRYRWIACGDS